MITRPNAHTGRLGAKALGQCGEIKEYEYRGHSQEDLGCIHHIAGEDSLAEGSHRHSWTRTPVSLPVSF